MEKDIESLLAMGIGDEESVMEALAIAQVQVMEGSQSASEVVGIAASLLLSRAEEEEERYLSSCSDDSEDDRAVLNAFEAFDDSSSSSSSDGEAEGGGGETSFSAAPTMAELPAATVDDDDDDDENLDAILDGYILENRQLLGGEGDGENDNNNDEDDDRKLPANPSGRGGSQTLPPPAPPVHSILEMSHDRKRTVQARLQQKLVSKGVTPASRSSEADDDPESVGKTLMQKVLEAEVSELSTRLEQLRAHEREQRLMNKEMKRAKGNAKALAGQYVRKQDVADDTRKRANVHHAGSHYHMAASRSMQKGRKQGLMARHSAQGSRLQASRMASRAGLANMLAARDVAKGQMGEKKGKSKGKSKMKTMGDAGGSKKSGGGGKKKGGGGGGKGGGGAGK